MINKIIPIYDGENISLRFDGEKIVVYLNRNSGVYKGAVFLRQQTRQSLSLFMYCDEIIEMKNGLIERRNNNIKLT